MRTAVPVAAGIAVGFAFVALFSAWAANPSLYGAQPAAGQSVSIPEGASKQGGQFEPQAVNIRAGEFVKWTNNETSATNLIIEPACKPLLQDKGANVTSFGVEKYLAPGDSFTCGFSVADEYHVHTEPWPWMKGTINVTP